jgi:putative FmdB family regulatory protein
MPTYEYACKSCGEHLEVVQSFKDDALSECPNCGGPLRKVFGSIGIAFKGSGFYKTDSRSANGAGKSAPSGDHGSDGAKSDGAKSDGAKSDGPKSAPSSTGESSGNKTSKKESTSSGEGSGGSPRSTSSAAAS